MHPSPETDKLLLENSIERTINTTTKLLGIMQRRRVFHNRPDDQEDLDINLEDWEELKQLTRWIWNDARNEAFKRANPAA